MLVPLFSTRLFHENPPHCLRGGGKEVASTIPLLGLVRIDQPEIRLVYQRGGLERLPRLLVSKLRRRELAQLVVDEWQELLGGCRVTLLDL